MKKFFCIALIAAAFCARAADRHDAIRQNLGTYSNAPRMANGRIDCNELINQLLDQHANSYSFAIHRAATDWDDLKVFLPLAREKHLRVWASLVPPSESPPRTQAYSEPFRMDYERWAVEFAKLSLQEPNLIGWSIDDFPYNVKFFTPEKMKGILDGAHSINPNFMFVPCVYFKQITPAFITNYIPLFDGILFPYRDESHGGNLKDPSHVEEEVQSIRSRLGKNYPIVVDIYFTAHSRLGASTADYCERATIAAHNSNSGVQVYTHQDPVKNAEKYQIVKKLFAQWSKGSGALASPRSK
ncbi:MAG: hypothetical protein JWO95_160 [Verrucomicrobiales bacterium]|nr:hypothetical protein [Verrucomicrobiales bacterium]